jgi:hypothetical protein
MSTKYELKNLATGKTSQLDAISGTIGPMCSIFRI